MDCLRTSKKSTGCSSCVIPVKWQWHPLVWICIYRQRSSFPAPCVLFLDYWLHDFYTACMYLYVYICIYMYIYIHMYTHLFITCLNFTDSSVDYNSCRYFGCPFETGGLWQGFLDTRATCQACRAAATNHGVILHC